MTLVAIWNTLHDGYITRIAHCEFELAIDVEIDYIGPYMPSEDGFVRLLLNGSVEPVFRSWDDEITKGARPIQDLELDILSAEEDENAIKVITNDGVMILSYLSVAYQDRKGKALDYEIIADAARKYWEEWSSKRNS